MQLSIQEVFLLQILPFAVSYKGGVLWFPCQPRTGCWQLCVVSCVHSGIMGTAAAETAQLTSFFSPQLTLPIDTSPSLDTCKASRAN